MKRCTYLLLVVLVVAVCTSSASAARIYTDGAGDGYIHFIAPVYSMGPYTADSVVDLSNFSCWLPNPDWGYEPCLCQGYCEGVLIFDLTSLRGKTLSPGGATLNVYANLQTGSWRLRHCTEDYGSSVFFPHFGAGQVVTSLPLMSAAGWIRLDVTSCLQQDINNGLDNSAFIIAYSSGVGTGSYWASESGTGPYLEVPEPGTILALLCSLSGLGCLAWRKKR